MQPDVIYIQWVDCIESIKGMSMKMKFAAAVACSMMAASALAAPDVTSTTVPNALDTYVDGWTSNPITHPKDHAFADTFNFTLGVASDVDYGYTLKTLGGKNVRFDSFSLTGLGVNVAKSTLAGDDISSYTFSNLAAGAYSFTLNGLSTGRTGGQYTLSLGATPAVPEPESIALALAGLGVISLMARRKLN